MLTQENLLLDIFASCGRVAAGFLTAAVVGIPLGIAIGTFPIELWTKMRRNFDLGLCEYERCIKAVTHAARDFLCSNLADFLITSCRGRGV
jgi:hypothetical protein